MTWGWDLDHESYDFSGGVWILGERSLSHYMTPKPDNAHYFPGDIHLPASILILPENGWHLTANLSKKPMPNCQTAKASEDPSEGKFDFNGNKVATKGWDKIDPMWLLLAA